jgi:hypothetical protein
VYRDQYRVIIDKRADLIDAIERLSEWLTTALGTFEGSVASAAATSVKHHDVMLTRVVEAARHFVDVFGSYAPDPLVVSGEQRAAARAWNTAGRALVEQRSAEPKVPDPRAPLDKLEPPFGEHGDGADGPRQARTNRRRRL